MKINPHLPVDDFPNDEDMPGLDIFASGKIIGRLSICDGELNFAYADSWISEGDPLSEYLPFSGKYSSRDVYNYFVAFMPEGRRKELLVSYDKISGNNLIGFLRRHGEDLPGQLYALPLGKSNGNEDITRKIAKLTENDESFVNVAKQHSLLAGVDDKIAVIASKKGNHWTFQLSNIENPSTHIIKKSNSLCVNEFFCTRLAQSCGLSVMPCDLLAFNGKEAFITQRYDRAKDHTGKIARIEQKDFCQLAGKSPEEKYYRAGTGVSNEDIANILLPLGGDNIQIFLSGSLFSLIIGNNDDHGKNYALLYAPEAHFAPLYDLASISALMMFDETASGTNRLSRPIGKSLFAASLTPADMEDYAKIFHVENGELLDLFDTMLESVEKNVQDIEVQTSKRIRELKLPRQDEVDFLKLHITERCKFFREFVTKCKMQTSFSDSDNKILDKEKSFPDNEDISEDDERSPGH